MFDFLKKKSKKDNNIVTDSSAVENEPITKAIETQKVDVYTSSEHGTARYRTEHVLIRDMFFRQPQLVVNVLEKEGGAFELYRKCYEFNGLECPYQPKDFRMLIYDCSNNGKIICVHFPKPEYMPLCYRVYFAFTEDFSKLEYYTIEISLKNDGYLCKWVGGIHENIHHIAAPEWKENAGIWQATEMKIVTDLFETGKTE